MTESAPETPLISHLVELRSRLLRIAAGILVGMLILAPFARELFTLMAEPLARHLPDESSLIATEVASPFLTPFKLALVGGVMLSIPHTLYQIWAFVAPGLYKREQRLVFPLLVSSSLLFYLGSAFAWFVVLPIIFGFFVAVAPEGVAVMTDIRHYLNFVLALFVAFGIAFQVPVATVLLVRAGATTPAALKKKRPYVLVGTFVIGMVLTPPDIISQTLLAVPVYALFELGLIMAYRLVPGIKEVEAQRGER
ncbi:sec-independent protein translocase protein TatC [Natronospira proteinivora]|uniref:Sec-independent protein translocase protein TatC n=1 Tax=Natronospira proteinivora TaxID=1807133 RepID=A0ABT1GB52_9GAMM|nr:sec-independent protein translocase protein TatC [Natronospira proteinivora]